MKTKYVLKLHFANKFSPLILEYNNKSDCKTDLLRINEGKRKNRLYLLIYNNEREFYINIDNICYFCYYLKIEDIKGKN